MSQLGELGFRKKWQTAWQFEAFRRKVQYGSFALIAVFCFFPFFFKIIEKRNGIVLNDWLLDWLTPHDVSATIFVFVWGVTILLIIRMIQQPGIFLVMLWAYVLLCLMRIVTISAFALDAPRGLLALEDPLSNIFYGNGFITKDLFYSGHTSTAFLMFLCLEKKSDKIFALISSLVIGSLLLVQHVHYTIDVLAAPLFASFSYYLSRKINRDIR